MSIRNTLLFLSSVVGVTCMQAAPFAYISTCCNNPSYMSLVSTATNTQTGSIQTGTGGFAVAISPDNSLAYVTNTVSQSISVIQISTKLIINTFPIGHPVQWIAISPDGSKLYVTSKDTASSGYIFGLSARTGVLFATYASPGVPTQMAVTPDGTKLFAGISSSGGTSQYGVLQLDANLLTITGFLGGNYGVGGMAVTPDGTKLYVANQSNPGTPTAQLTVFSTSTLSQIANIPLTGGTIPGTVAVNSTGTVAYVTEGGTTPGVGVVSTANNILTTTLLTGGLQPVQAAASSDGTKLYVTTSTSSSLLAYSATNYQTLATINLAGSLNGVAVSGDSSTVFAPNYGSAQVAIVDTATSSIVSRIPVGDMSSGNSNLAGGAVVNPTQTYVFVTNYESNNVSVISTATHQVVANIPVGPRPIALAITPRTGAQLFVANSGNNTISVIDAVHFTVTSTITPPVKTGNVMTALAIDPTANKLYVSVAAGTLPLAKVAPSETLVASEAARSTAGPTSTVLQIKISTLGTVGSIAMTGPIALGILPTSSTTYDVLALASNGVNEALTPIDPLKRVILTANVIPTNLAPGTGNVTNSIAVATGNNIVFATFSNSVFSFNMSGKTYTNLGSGGAPSQLALTPDGTELWVTNTASTSVSVFSAANGSTLNTLSVGSNSYGIAIAHQ